MTGALRESDLAMTAEEFLNWDGGGHVGKLELVNGVVQAMSPASGTHAVIQANLAIHIGNHLRARKMPSRVGPEAPVIPRLRGRDNVLAPDLAVTCAEATAGKTFPDPVLIVEVLSPSNQKETWDSIMACTTIPTLCEVLVVDSERVWAKVYRKDSAGAWPKDADVPEAAGQVVLDSIGAELALSDIYEGTQFAAIVARNTQ